MRTKIQRWGNSLALRIPRPLAEEIPLAENSQVDLKIVDGQMVVTPIPRPSFTLEELVAQITDENRHAEIPVGRSVGVESW